MTGNLTKLCIGKNPGGCTKIVQWEPLSGETVGVFFFSLINFLNSPIRSRRVLEPSAHSRNAEGADLGARMFSPRRGG